jgi:hypothetical protein
MSKKHWAVTVRVDGEEILTIESNSLSGASNVSDYREQIVTAADHLIAFIGREDGPYFEFPPDDLPQPKQTIPHT